MLKDYYGRAAAARGFSARATRRAQLTPGSNARNLRQKDVKCLEVEFVGKDLHEAVEQILLRQGVSTSQNLRGASEPHHNTGSSNPASLRPGN